MALTDVKVKTAKPKEKPYKLADGGGMYLLINANGSKYWRMKYRFAGKEKMLSIGVYPDVSLADAREKRNEARKILATLEKMRKVRQRCGEVFRYAIVTGRADNNPAPDLASAFPLIQFIVTTYSPQVISTVKRESVRLLEQDENGNGLASIPLGAAYGEPSNDVLQSVMGVDPQPPN